MLHKQGWDYISTYMLDPGSAADNSPPLITESNTPPPYLSQAAYDLLQNAQKIPRKI
jgi:hypothetical protein